MVREICATSMVCVRRVRKWSEIAASEDLRLVLQAAKGAGMDDAVAITLERVTIRMRRLGIAAPARILDANGVRGEHRAV